MRLWLTWIVMMMMVGTLAVGAQALEGSFSGCAFLARGEREKKRCAQGYLLRRSTFSERGASCCWNTEVDPNSVLRKNLNQQPAKDDPIALYPKTQALVFISFSMTDASLQSLSRAVQKIGGRLILRGLMEDSFQKTAAKLQKLEISVDLDPGLFDRFEVQRVPTFVHCFVTEAGPDIRGHDWVAGHMPLLEALRFFHDRGTVPGASDLVKVLQREVVS